MEFVQTESTQFRTHGEKYLAKKGGRYVIYMWCSRCNTGVLPENWHSHYTIVHRGE